jgi:hypothetical protein
MDALEERLFPKNNSIRSLVETQSPLVVRPCLHAYLLLTLLSLLALNVILLASNSIAFYKLWKPPSTEASTCATKALNCKLLYLNIII